MSSIFFSLFELETDSFLRLVKYLEQISAESAKVLIFIGTKRVADELTKYLRQDGWPALAIHGDKQQQERDWVLAEFKSGRSPIMIATVGPFLLFFEQLTNPFAY